MILKEYVEVNGTKKWKKISERLKKDAKDCRNRWFNVLNGDILKTPWTLQEEEELCKLME